MGQETNRRASEWKGNAENETTGVCGTSAALTFPHRCTFVCAPEVTTHSHRQSSHHASHHLPPPHTHTRACPLGIVQIAERVNGASRTVDNELDAKINEVKEAEHDLKVLIESAP